MAIYIVKSWYKKGDNEPIWVPKTWNGNTDIYGQDVWSDGTDIYYSNGRNAQYVLTK